MRKTTIGGSALIEGLMMIGPQEVAIAVRNSEGDIIIEKRELSVKSKLSKIPILRGVVSFVRQMLLSTNALIYSTSFLYVEEEGSSFVDKLLKRVFDDRLKDVVIYFSLILSLSFTIGFSMLPPNILAGILKLDKNTYRGVIYSNIFEGVIKILIFLG